MKKSTKDLIGLGIGTAIAFGLYKVYTKRITLKKPESNQSEEDQEEVVEQES